MARNTVRSLCAQIAVEIEPKKIEALIEELTLVLLGDYVQSQARIHTDTDGEAKFPKGLA